MISPSCSIPPFFAGPSGSSFKICTCACEAPLLEISRRLTPIPAVFAIYVEYDGVCRPGIAPPKTLRSWSTRNKFQKLPPRKIATVQKISRIAATGLTVLWRSGTKRKGWREAQRRLLPSRVAGAPVKVLAGLSSSKLASGQYFQGLGIIDCPID